MSKKPKEKENIDRLYRVLAFADALQVMFREPDELDFAKLTGAARNIAEAIDEEASEVLEVLELEEMRASR